jgi:mycofactocin precursor
VTHPPTQTGPDATPEAPLAEEERELVEEDLLVEDVSIDGMCGVY